MMRTGPAFYIRTGNTQIIQVSTVDGKGCETNYQETTAAELLLQRVELNFVPLRNEVNRLWQQYPLDYYDLPKRREELSRLAEEVLADSEMLRDLDPLGYFYVSEQLHCYQPELQKALGSENMDLMESAATLMNTLEEPAWSQIPLRNMFEIAFDGMERATQQERYELLTRTYANVYPPVVDRYYPVRRITISDDGTLLSGELEYRVESLDDLHHLLFSVYFGQKRQRIVRCECCWEFFIPPTARPARYCDRVIDGKSCKQLGPNLRHAVELSRDAALGTYEALRRRMIARRERYYNAAPDGRGNLIHMDLHEYDAWDQIAQTARKEYLDGKINAEDFLKRIDLYHDLDSYDVDMPKNPGKSIWRRQVEQNIRFDPYQAYPSMMALNLRVPDPHWETIPSETRMRDAQGDARSLRDLQKFPDDHAQEEVGTTGSPERDELSDAVRAVFQILMNGQ